MRTLLWKDFRQNLRMFIAAGVFLVLPYVVALTYGVATLFGTAYERKIFYERGGWTVVMFGAAVFALGIAVGLSAFVAGNAVAGERADRSSEFASYLPISRVSAITSKAILAIGFCVCIFAGNVIVYLLMSSSLPNLHRSSTDADVAWNFLATFSCLFGVAWLVSSLSNSPAMAAVSGLVAAGLIGMVNEMAFVEQGSWFFRTACIVLGLGGFLAGIGYYVRRVEP